MSQYNHPGYWDEPVGYSLEVAEDRLVIEFDDVQFGRYIKIHSRFYELAADGTILDDAATFTLAEEDPYEVTIVSAGRLELYTYDDKGNRVMASYFARGEFRSQEYRYYAGSDLILTDGNEGFVYDANNRMVARGDTYTVTGDGVELEPVGSYRRYEYDLRGRLAAVYGYDEDADEVVLISRYSYNDRGYRIYAESADGGSVAYMFDSHPTHGKVLEETAVPAGGGESEVTTYVYFGRLHLARIRDGEVEYYGTDHLGSTVLLTDRQGREIWSGSVTPFADQESSGAGDQVKFTGKDLDTATGLYYFNARWYDPQTGRFISEDPIRDGANWYIYVGNNPLGFVDPSGLMSERLRDISQNIEGVQAEYHALHQSSEINTERGMRRATEYQATLMDLYGEYNREVVNIGNLTIEDYIQNGQITGEFGAEQNLTGSFRTTGHAGVDGVGGSAMTPFYTRLINADERASNVLTLEIIGTNLNMQIIHGDRGSYGKTGGFFAPSERIMPFPTRNNAPSTSTGPHFHIQIADGKRFYDPLSLRPSEHRFQFSRDGGNTWLDFRTDFGR
ncbi:RHS repeat-associated core domain-containing protein [Spirochaeta africana]|uniref:RHS repeat-associated core domain-containing protein n=1 Tax=Spirochaeta africana TaxID=46355 RepID=UPI0012E9FC49|nr:RHS repeat-associated core domain-containing protein [Spirochaeta africana]